MVSNICTEDIIQVANSLNVSLTETQVNKILHLYNEEEECDPTGTWDLIVEHCIYKIINEN
jgi:uncharacterized protein YpuA (DUF1002 family)